MAKAKVKKINQAEMLEHIRAIEANKIAIKDLEDQIKADQEAIIKTMHEFGLEEMVIDIFKVSYKDVETTRIDSKSLKKEMPDLYNRFSYTSVSKRFLIA